MIKVCWKTLAMAISQLWCDTPPPPPRPLPRFFTLLHPLGPILLKVSMLGFQLPSTEKLNRQCLFLSFLKKKRLHYLQLITQSLQGQTHLQFHCMLRNICYSHKPRWIRTMVACCVFTRPDTKHLLLSNATPEYPYSLRHGNRFHRKQPPFYPRMQWSPLFLCGRSNATIITFTILMSVFSW